MQTAVMYCVFADCCLLPSNRSELMDEEKIRQLESVSFPLHYAEYYGDGKAIGVSFDYYSEDPEPTIYMIDLVNDEIVGE